MNQVASDVLGDLNVFRLVVESSLLHESVGPLVVAVEEKRTGRGNSEFREL